MPANAAGARNVTRDMPRAAIEIAAISRTKVFAIDERRMEKQAAEILDIHRRVF